MGWGLLGNSKWLWAEGGWVQSSVALVKLNIQKTKIMASGPITSWGIDGETVETVADFFGGAPKSLQKIGRAHV